MKDGYNEKGCRSGLAAAFRERMAIPCIPYTYCVPDELWRFAVSAEYIRLGLLTDDCFVRLWMNARKLFEYGNDRCLAYVLAADYAAALGNDVWEMAAGLKSVCVNEENLRFWLANLLGGLQRAEINLNKAFEAELKKNAGYYLGDELAVLLKKAERELNTVDEGEFSAQLCVLIRRFERDVNERTNAFAEAAYKEYLKWASSIQSYVKKIENNL